MSDEARVAVYYAPPADDPLAMAGATWLGRDGETNAPLPQPDLPDIAAITADPQGYAFHATLKPPMRLARGTDWFQLIDAVEALAGRIAPFDLPPLAVSDVHGFLALRETLPCPALQSLADLCVSELDRFRAPPEKAELARRRRAGLSDEQERMLVRWGYPYVFGTWFFHMTLTRRLTLAEKAIYQPAAEAYFAGALKQPRTVSDICLFTQSAPGAPFKIAERFPLRG
jgi:putative phosphonate metabolism protein